MHPLLGHGTKQTSTKYKLKSRNQIIIKHACEVVLRYISVARGGAGGPPPNCNAPNDKNVKKKDYYFFSLSFFQRLRVQHYTRTAVINNNIDRGGPGSLNLIFANQFTMGPLQ